MGTGPTASAARVAVPAAGELPPLSSELLRDIEKLNPRHRRFFLELFQTNFNATEAYRRAYGPRAEKNADVLGPRLLGTDRMQALLAKYRGRQEQRLALTAAEIDEERRRIAKVDPRRLCASDGRPLGLHELDEDTARALAKVKFKVAKVVRGPKAAAAAAALGVKADPDAPPIEEVTLGTVEFAFHSKNEALAHGDKVLGRHVEKHEFVGPTAVTVNIGVRRKAKTTGEK
jgi:hypothetical protein